MSKALLQAQYPIMMAPATRAHGGTLFLDEICEMDLALQAKLLRLIQTGTLTRVGGDRVENVDIRFICATNRNPWAEVQSGRFREDLYYRLMVIPIELPPLRSREDDVVLIARHFLKCFAAEESKKFQDFDFTAEQIIRSYEWPGNVRQLQNVIRNIVVLNNAEFVTTDMLPPPLNSVAVPPSNAIQLPASSQKDAGSSHAEIKPLWLAEKEIIESAIQSCGGNIPKAAQLLEVSPSTIYRKKMGWEEQS